MAFISSLRNFLITFAGTPTAQSNFLVIQVGTSFQIFKKMKENSRRTK